MAGDKSAAQTFTIGTVACLIAAMAESGVVVGQKHYTIMHQIDNSRTVSGYEHFFREAKKEAKRTNDKIASGEIKVDGGSPNKKANAGGKTATLASGEKKAPKRGTKNKKSVDDESDDGKASPSKRVKAESEQD
ncbi:hypothetical protein LTR85_008400 [Meristemomyces frigidus]|nr:hypothetical protein LTR85_008400 [Meristemomyces frigidus]